MAKINIISLFSCGLYAPHFASEVMRYIPAVPSNFLRSLYCPVTVIHTIENSRLPYREVKLRCDELVEGGSLRSNTVDKFFFTRLGLLPFSRGGMRKDSMKWLEKYND